MALQRPDFPVSLAGHAATFVAALDAIGAPWRSGLGRVGLPTEMADPLEWLPTHNLLRFVHGMACQEAIPDLGILVGQKDHPGAVHPVLVRAIGRAPSLYAAMVAVCEHAHLQGSHIHFSLLVSGDALLVRHWGSVSARLLHVTFTLRDVGRLIRVISARDMHRKERIFYGKAKKEDS